SLSVVLLIYTTSSVPLSFFFEHTGYHHDLHLFPYTTLFRSRHGARLHAEDHRAQGDQPEGLPREERGVAVLPARLDAGLKHLHADRKSTRLNSSHVSISYAVFCLKKKKQKHTHPIPNVTLV